jgi:glycerophosphoryl diester phosphodiesterase
MEELVAEDVRIIAPPLWFLLRLDSTGQIVPTAYAKSAKAVGLEIVTWTLESSGPLSTGGGWYYQSIAEAITQDGDTYRVLDILAKDVGIQGMFSDWPATITYYANCMNLN